MNKYVNIGANAVVMLIGLYMVFTNFGPISPPLLSGIAFIFVAIANCQL